MHLSYSIYSTKKLDRYTSFFAGLEVWPFMNYFPKQTEIFTCNLGRCNMIFYARGREEVRFFICNFGYKKAPL